MIRFWLLLSLVVPLALSNTLRGAEFDTTWRVEFENVTDPSASFDAGTSTYSIGTGQQFRANVYVNSSQAYKGLDLTFGWGSADSMGVDATNLSSAFTMNGVTIDEGGLFDYHMIPSDSNTGLGGFRQDNDGNTGLRPYGQYLSLYNNSGPISAGTDVKIASFLFTNNLAHGSSGSLVLWDAGRGASWTSQAVDSAGNFSRPGGSQNYNINSVPEPGSLIAMGAAGMGVLLNTLRLRRKR